MAGALPLLRPILNPFLTNEFSRTLCSVERLARLRVAGICKLCGLWIETASAKRFSRLPSWARQRLSSTSCDSKKMATGYGRLRTLNRNLTHLAVLAAAEEGRTLTPLEDYRGCTSLQRIYYLHLRFEQES
ncbi:hypothetical protein AVEN_145024-1 [Araneus ventricosus]|uniref:Uncharacterized protein n=1 Tax=Araneus ventricosus TaxID=182803 RepID=A0A4Y2T1N3_ARAVE|nr:hypothetical protein AVEN_145024-1 [Araneus ventricosus]